MPLDTATVGVVLLEQCARILDEIGNNDMGLVDKAMTMIDNEEIVYNAKYKVKSLFISQVEFAAEKPEVAEKFDLKDVLQTGLNLIDQA